jgi:hypothetical protein
MIEPFKPITREQAAGILDISLTTLDALITSKVLPAPRQLGECRKVYWHPDVFYGALHHRLAVHPAATALPTSESPETACATPPREDDAHSEVAAASRDTVTAVPQRARRYGDALARQAERLEALNQCSTPSGTRRRRRAP